MVSCKANAQERAVAVKDRAVNSESVLPTPLVRWMEALERRGGAELATLLVRLLQVWGFVGSQLLWMAAPFVGEQTVGPIARVLEDPEALKALKRRTTKGADR